MDLICSQEDFFKNPNKVPLNKLFLNYKNVIRASKEQTSLEQMLSVIDKPSTRDQWSNRYQVKMEKKPALDQCWLNETLRYVEFQQFYLQFDEKENDEFLQQNNDFLKSLQYLISCSYHQFWCNIVCEPRASLIIKDFLRHAMAPFSVSRMSERCQTLYNEIYNSIFLIYERLLNFKHSETEYMDEDTVRKYLSDAELVNVRSIYSFTFIYNHSCPEFVKRLTSFYFCDTYSAYKKEVHDLLMDIMHDLDKFGGNTLGLISNSKIPFGIRPKPDEFDVTWLEEMSLYALELASSLTEFFGIYEPAVELAFELELPNAISHVYKFIYSEFLEMYENEKNVHSRYKDLSAIWIALGKTQFLELFHKFMIHLHANILRLKNNSEDQNKALESYLELISVAMDDDLFIKDYNKSFPIETQLKELTKQVPTFDKTQSDYLLVSLTQIIDESEPNQAEVTPAKHKSTPTAPINNHLSSDLHDSVYDTLTQYLQAETAPSGGPSTSTAGFKSKNLPEPVVIALKQYVELKKGCNGAVAHRPTAAVPQVRDDPNRPSKDEIDKRIKTVLEMLPDLDSLFILRCLEEMDFQPEQVISRVLDGNLPGNLVNMGFKDIIPPETPAQAMKLLGYVGKKPGHQDALSLLNDKNEDIKNLVLQATNKYDLDDDYDERDEMYGSRSKGYERIQQTDISEYAAISDPSSGSEEDETQPKPSKDFCEDPTIIRARREAERGRNFRGRGQTRNTDVVGKPKNQGQEATVVQNRNHKNVHKSSRANHNRKGGAQFKRNRGMMPS